MSIQPRLIAAAGLLILLPGAAAPRGDDPPTPAGEARPSPFHFRQAAPGSLAIDDDGRPVLVYNHGTIAPPPGVPADRARACYVHPLYGLDGEVLTDDFPADHHHHRGLFWVWPHVRVDGHEVDLWLIRGIAQKFESWERQSAGPDRAILAVRNGWYVDGKKVMDERVTLTVHRPAADGQSRAIDCAFAWTPTDRPIALEGAEGKSYGGFTLRYAPGTDTTITTADGSGPDDLLDAPLAWADLTRTWDQPPGVRSGASLFVPPSHPNFPPTWLTRHYGALCIGWPGTTPRTFEPGVPIHTSYRVWIHRGAPDAAAIRRAYETYAAPTP